MSYGKELSHKHNHKMWRVSEEDKRVDFQAHPQQVAKEERIGDWKKRQGGGRRLGGPSWGAIGAFERWMRLPRC